MSKYIFLIIAIASISSCKNKDVQSANATNATTQTTTEEIIDTKEAILDLDKLVGQMPKDIDLFNKFNIGTRIKALLGKEYEDFAKDWNTETPLSKDGNIMYTSGCRAENCIASNYFIVFDLIDNNINIYHYKHERGRTYEEGAVIGMPFKLADEFEKMIAKQGIY